MSFDELVSRLTAQSYPPVARWNPEFTGDMDLVIKANGDWIHEGSKIQRHGLVKLLASVLVCENDEVFLVSPVEKYRIEVEDAPFLVVEVDAESVDAEHAFIFRSNVDDLIQLSREHRLWTETNPTTGEPRPYLHVRDGLNALINRNVFYQLAELAQERVVDGVNRSGLVCAGEFYPLD